jgi:site-specific recombinase XerD
LNKFSRFNPAAVLSDFTPSFLQKYKEHCFSLGNEENTVWKSLKAIRVIILRAHKEGLIKTNPFPLFEMPKYRDPQKIWLTDLEVEAIEKLREREIPKEIYFTATWFLIGCYTGLRFGDMVQFNKREHIRQGRLILYTSKTGEVVSMPFTDRLKKLFESIDYKSIYFSNGHYNRLLKQVQGLAEIKRTLTGHVSRHSAAVRWANHGVSQEVVGKLLGHSNLKTTAIYFKISGMRIDKELPE